MVSLPQDYSSILKDLRSQFATNKTADLKWRKAQLKAIIRMCEERHEEITTAVLSDLGGAKLRGIFEMGGAVKGANLALKNLDSWSSPKRVSLWETWDARMIYPTPKGVVLLIAPWNYPISLVLVPLVNIISAGNCVVIKPSEISSHSARFLETVLPKYVDSSCIKVITGGVSVSKALLELNWDHICYTGSTNVGKIVMESAAKHLTPVTLELGGKCPAIIDTSAKLDVAVNRILGGKLLNAGQTCLAPDYVLVPKTLATEFVNKCVDYIKKNYGEGQGQKFNQDYGKIISVEHAKRISNLIKTTNGQIIVGDVSLIDENERFIPPTIIVDPPQTDAIMQEEIFGPVLPIIAYNKIEDAINIVNSKETPLAVYVFAENDKVVQRVLKSTNSGGACVNTAVEHVLDHNLPFGGSKNSGIGKYHGKYGFDEFTHLRAVVYKPTYSKGFIVPPPPYTDIFYTIALKMGVTGFLTRSQRRVLTILLKILKVLVLVILTRIAYKKRHLIGL